MFKLYLLALLLCIVSSTSFLIIIILSCNACKGRSTTSFRHYRKTGLSNFITSVKFSDEMVYKMLDHHVTELFYNSATKCH